MGNQLTRGVGDSMISNSIIGQNLKKNFEIDYERINEIIDLNNKNKDKPNYKKTNFPEDSNIDILERGCCLGLNRVDNFITIKIPSIGEDNRISYQNLGYEIIKNSEDEKKFNATCKKLGLIKNQLKCDALMVDKCSKSLYDSGCIQCKKRPGDKECAPAWNSRASCFNPDKTLAYGNEECSCINSYTGFTLNMNPSSSITTAKFKKNENPYGVNGTTDNDFTKYSLNVFDYDSTQQMPQVLDTRCSSSDIGGGKISGKTKPYLLPSYKRQQTLCLNQIKIGNSNIGKANFNNIRQQNNCGAVKFKDDKVSQKVDKKNEVSKNEQVIKEAKKEKIDTENKTEDQCQKEGYRSCADKIKILESLIKERKQEVKTQETETTVSDSSDNSKLIIILIGVLIVVIIILILIFLGKR